MMNQKFVPKAMHTILPKEIQNVISFNFWNVMIAFTRFRKILCGLCPTKSIYCLIFGMMEKIYFSYFTKIFIFYEKSLLPYIWTSRYHLHLADGSVACWNVSIWNSCCKFYQLGKRRTYSLLLAPYGKVVRFYYVVCSR